MDLSSDVFSTFFSYYWNFDIGMFVLRSSISLEASKKKKCLNNKQTKNSSKHLLRSGGLKNQWAGGTFI